MRDLILFDLDQTLVDSRPVAALRRQRRWNAVYEGIPRLRAYDGVGALWNALDEQGRLLGVVTSSPRPYCERVLDHLSLDPQVTVCYHDTVRHKPHPAPLLEAAKRAVHPPEQVFYIGDAPEDMQAARAASILGIGALWGTESIYKLRYYATRSFMQPSDLESWLLSVAV